ncbi:hypothetical protein [Streptomyces cyaneofuscatus]|uniref:hypothetical protein n=1 Tax=Streptomyces cyaneofuscatus TaxID=66883 RepID=UPI0036DAF721
MSDDIDDDEVPPAHDGLPPAAEGCVYWRKKYRYDLCPQPHCARCVYLKTL